MKPFNGPFNVEFEDDILRRLLFDKSDFCVSAHAKEYILGNTRKYQGGGELKFSMSITKFRIIMRLLGMNIKHKVSDSLLASQLCIWLQNGLKIKL